MKDLNQFVTSHKSTQFDQEVIAAASACLDRFTAAFNRCSTGDMDAELNFPHVMLSGSEQMIWLHPGQHPDDFFEKLHQTGWGYTQYEDRVAVLSSQDKAHFLVTYSRRNLGGKVLSMHQNLWITTRRDGRWGISLRSY